MYVPAYHCFEAHVRWPGEAWRSQGDICMARWKTAFTIRSTHGMSTVHRQRTTSIYRPTKSAARNYINPHRKQKRYYGRDRAAFPILCLEALQSMLFCCLCTMEVIGYKIRCRVRPCVCPSATSMKCLQGGDQTIGLQSAIKISMECDWVEVICICLASNELKHGVGWLCPSNSFDFKSIRSPRWIVEYLVWYCVNYVTRVRNNGYYRYYL